LAAQRIAVALAARLAEPGGPEIVIVASRRADGWLSEQVMGAARAVLLRNLHEANRHGRLRFYAPVTRDGQDIYVHAKVLVIDDRLLRIGSSSLNNRSMGLDTECDIAVEAAEGGDDTVRREILRVRDGLVAEYLGVSKQAFQEAVGAAEGSLTGALDRLVRTGGRTLRPFEASPLNPIECNLARTHLLDPDHPETMDEAFTRSRRVLRPAMPYIVSAIALVAGTVVSWRRYRASRRR